MKKLFLTTSILLLAAACSKQTVQVQNAQNQPAQSSQAQVTPTPTQQTDETADWKTYSSDQLGFSIKYPSDWSVKEVPSDSDDYHDVYFAPDASINKNQPYVDLAILTGTFQLTVPNKSTSTPISVDGLRGSKELLTLTNGKSGIIYIFGDTNISFRLNTTGFVENDQDAISKAQTMFSTFKFNK